MQDSDLMEFSRLVNEKLGTEEKIGRAMEKIEEGVVNGYKKIEEGVVNGYKKIEEGAVSSFNKVSDKFVEELFAREGENIEGAKARLAAGAKQHGAGQEEKRDEEE